VKAFSQITWSLLPIHRFYAQFILSESLPVFEIQQTHPGNITPLH